MLKPKLRTMFRIYGIGCLLALSTPAFSGEMPRNLPSCPTGQSRPIIEVIETPAIIKDIYGKVEELRSTGISERVTPSVTKWVDIPKDYVRPETIKIITTYANEALYVPQYETYIFRESSYDEVHLVNGQIDRRKVPTIYSQRVKYVLDPSTVGEKTKLTETPYDSQINEKDGKLLIIVSGPKHQILNTTFKHEINGIVRQERTPARIRQMWGDCETKEIKR